MIFNKFINKKILICVNLFYKYKFVDKKMLLILKTS